MTDSSLLEVLKYIGPFIGGIVTTATAYMTFFAKRRKDKGDLDLTYQEQITNQYNHIVGRLDKLEGEKVQLMEENIILKDKILRLEYKLSEEFNYLAIMQSFFTYLPKPTWLTSPEGLVYYANDSCADAWGVSKLFCEGQPYNMIWGREISDSLELNDNEVITKKKPIIVWERYPVAPGSDVYEWREVMKWPIMHDDKIIGIGGLSCGRVAEVKHDN